MGKEIIVQLASPERKFVKTYLDFLQNELLSAEEKIVFIVLKSFVDFSKDNGSTQGEAYPTMETVCRLSSLSRPRATRTINKLIEKKIVKKIRRGLTKSNVYILSDFASMWACDSVEDMAAIAQNDGVKPLTAAEHVAGLERLGYKVTIQEKGLVSDDRQAADTSTTYYKSSKEDDTTAGAKSQAEQYTMENIKALFDYQTLRADRPEHEADLEVVFDILHEVLNTSKKTVRVSGEDKPAAVVAGKLLKLECYDILYALDKFHAQDTEIKNTRAYLLTILYHAREQSYLDLMNLGHRNGDF